MSTLAESNVLLRAQADLPAGFKVATEEMLAGWNLMRTGGAKRLKQKIQKSGWNLIQLAQGALRSGVGPSAKEAVSSALRLALRRIDSRTNAVEIEGVEVTKYPWFFLARVRVRSYRIQLDAELAAQASLQGADVEDDEQAPHLAEVYPQFGTALPMLKQLLVSGQA
jgi:hypothetical protein